MSEHKCVVPYCCCGCSLKSGSLAIGIITLIGALLQAIQSIQLALSGAEGSSAGWFSFIVNFVIIFLSCVLIHGIRHESRSFVMIYVWGMMVLIIIGLISAIILIVYTLDIILIIVTIVVYGLEIYFVVVVRSYGLSLGASPSMA